MEIAPENSEDVNHEHRAIELVFRLIFVGRADSFDSRVILIVSIMLNKYVVQ